MFSTLWFLAPLGAIALVLALNSFGINQEYERGVVFRLGRLRATKGPGWFWLVPLIERVVKVDLRTITWALDTQETVTRDGVGARQRSAMVPRRVRFRGRASRGVPDFRSLPPAAAGNLP